MSAERQEARQTCLRVKDDILQGEGKCCFPDDVTSLPRYYGFVSSMIIVQNMSRQVGSMAPDLGITKIISDRNPWPRKQSANVSKTGPQACSPIDVCYIRTGCRQLACLLGSLALEVGYTTEDSNIVRFAQGNPVDPEALDLFISVVEKCVCFVLNDKRITHSDCMHQLLTVYHDQLKEAHRNEELYNRNLWLDSMLLGFMHSCYNLTKPIDGLIKPLEIATSYLYMYVKNSVPLKQAADRNLIDDAIIGIIEETIVHITANAYGYSTPMKPVFEKMRDKELRDRVQVFIQKRYGCLLQARNENINSVGAVNTVHTTFCDWCWTPQHHLDRKLKRCGKCLSLGLKYGPLYCCKQCQVDDWKDKHKEFHYICSEYAANAQKTLNDPAIAEHTFLGTELYKAVTNRSKEKLEDSSNVTYHNVVKTSAVLETIGIASAGRMERRIHVSDIAVDNTVKEIEVSADIAIDSVMENREVSGIAIDSVMENREVSDIAAANIMEKTEIAATTEINDCDTPVIKASALDPTNVPGDDSKCATGSSAQESLEALDAALFDRNLRMLAIVADSVTEKRKASDIAADRIMETRDDWNVAEGALLDEQIRKLAIAAETLYTEKRDCWNIGEVGLLDENLTMLAIAADSLIEDREASYITTDSITEKREVTGIATDSITEKREVTGIATNSIMEKREKQEVTDIATDCITEKIEVSDPTKEKRQASGNAMVSLQEKREVCDNRAENATDKGLGFTMEKVSEEGVNGSYIGVNSLRKNSKANSTNDAPLAIESGGLTSKSVKSEKRQRLRTDHDRMARACLVISQDLWKNIPVINHSSVDLSKPNIYHNIDVVKALDDYTWSMSDHKKRCELRCDSLDPCALLHCDDPDELFDDYLIVCDQRRRRKQSMITS